MRSFLTRHAELVGMIGMVYTFAWCWIFATLMNMFDNVYDLEFPCIVTCYERINWGIPFVPVIFLFIRVWRGTYRDNTGIMTWYASISIC